MSPLTIQIPSEAPPQDTLSSLANHLLDKKNEAHNSNPTYFHLKKQLKKDIHSSLIDAPTIGDIFCIISPDKNKKIRKKLELWATGNPKITSPSCDKLKETFLKEMHLCLETLANQMFTPLNDDKGISLYAYDTLFQLVSSGSSEYFQQRIFSAYLKAKDITTTDSSLNQLLKGIHLFEQAYVKTALDADFHAYKEARKTFKERIISIINTKEITDIETLKTSIKSECQTIDPSILKKIDKTIEKTLAKRAYDSSHHLPKIEEVIEQPTPS